MGSYKIVTFNPFTIFIVFMYTFWCTFIHHLKGGGGGFGLVLAPFLCIPALLSNVSKAGTDTQLILPSRR
jgi:hypothetical protein